MAGTRRASRAARPAVQSSQPGIRAFGKVSKAAPNGDVVDKTKDDGNKIMKRRVPTPEPEDELESQSPTKRQCLQAPSARTPKKSEKAAHYLPTPENTPEKDRLLQPSKQFSISATRKSLSKAASPSPAPTFHYNSDDLPESIQDITRLYTSILRALSLHNAHNGISSPADVHKIASSASRIWSKRAVKLEDIRRCFGVEDSGFEMVDYGRGKICIEHKEQNIRSVVPQVLDEEKLTQSFTTKIQDLWGNHHGTVLEADDHEPETVDTFINNLPQANIAVTPTLEKIAPIFNLGKRRFEDFQNSQAQSRKIDTTSPTTPTHSRTTEPYSSPQSTHSTASTTSNSQPSTPTPRRVASPKLKASNSSLANRQSTLLARLSEKSARVAAEKASKRELTKTDLERRAALYRLPDIAGMLPLPRAGKSRSTYTLPELLQQIRDSSRTPLGSEEVETCLQILGEENISSGWVKIVETLSGIKGGIAGVVIDHGKRVDSAILKDRVKLELRKV